MTGLELLAVALGMRHGVDPDHLAAVDGLSRVRPSPLNGALFALGHGGIVTLLAFPAASLLQRVDLEALHLPVFLLLLVAGVALVVVGLARRERSDSALEILRERLARGEITAEQYEELRKLLQ